MAALEGEARVIELGSLPGRRLIPVAGHAVRREPGFHVIRIRGCVEVFAMAADAVRGQALVDAVRVAVGTGGRLVAALEGEARVIELGSLPGRRLIPVAGHAVRREPGFHVVRIRGGVEVFAMAADAVRGQALVDAVRVAVGTGRGLVAALEGEARVIELGSLPGRRLIPVAGHAVRREPRFHVIRIRGGVEVFAMAADTVRGQALVDAVRVAVGTGRGLMAALEREARMIELGSLPRRRLIPVAGHAVRREPRFHVIRIRGGVEVFAMAADAVRGQALVDAVRVAVGTGRGLMAALEREARMIELGSLPGRRLIPVAGHAVRREPRFHVIRIRGGVEVFAMAADTVRGQALVDAVRVAVGTGRRLMAALEREARVIELGSLPGRRLIPVAGHAVRWEPGFHVIRIRGCVEVFAMAADTVRGQALVDAVRVAVGTGGGLMAALEGEARVIELGSLPRRRLIPVAGHAVRRETRFHVIRIRGGVEVFAVAADAIGRLALETGGVTIRTLDQPMGSLQPEAGYRFMIPAIRRNRFPAGRVVAIPTNDTQRQ